MDIEINMEYDTNCYPFQAIV